MLTSMFQFLIAAVLFAAGAFAARSAALTPMTREAFWSTFTRNMGYGLVNLSLVYLVFQDLLSVKNVEGVIAIGVSASLMWAYSVKQDFCLLVLLKDLGLIGRVGYVSSLAGFVAQESVGRLFAAGFSFVLLIICEFAMNKLTAGMVSIDNANDDGGMGN
jgi:hypothetical protein